MQYGDRAHAYTQLFDKFIADHQLDYDDEDWTEEQRTEFRRLAEEQRAEWDAKQ